MSMIKDISFPDKAELAQRAVDRYEKLRIETGGAAHAVEDAIEKWLMSVKPEWLHINDEIIVEFKDGNERAIYKGTWTYCPIWWHGSIDYGIDLLHFTKRGKPCKDITAYRGVWIFNHCRKATGKSEQ